MTAQGEGFFAFLDDDLCTATYPGTARDPRQLCDQPVGHEGNHQALAEVAYNYRRHIVWTVDGEILPDIKTTRSGLPRAAGEQTPPTDGDQVT
jgi:hypothetical protein